MLCLVGQVSPTVLHLRDLRVRIDPAEPLLVRRLLVLPRPVEPSQIRPRRRLHPGRCRQPPNERLVGFPRVPTLDAPHRRVRFQRRRIDADRLPLHKPRFSRPLQNPREHRDVRLDVDQPTRSGQRRVVRRRLGHIQVQEGPQTQRVRHPPRNPAFGRQSLEVADEQHPEIPPGTQTRPAHPRRVEHCAEPLNEGVEPRLFQDPGSDARRKDAPRSSANPPSSPTAATPVALPVSLPIAMPFSIRNSTAPGPGRIPDFRHRLLNGSRRHSQSPVRSRCVAPLRRSLAAG